MPHNSSRKNKCIDQNTCTGAGQREHDQLSNKCDNIKTDYDVGLVKLKLFHDEWGFERDRRKLEQRKCDREKLLMEQRSRDEALDRKEILERKQQFNSEVKEGHILTQKVLKMMRQSGFKEGVNVPKRKPLPIQVETSKSVIIMKNEANIQFKTVTERFNSRLDEGENWFNVDLKLYRNVLSLKGVELGNEGAGELSKCFDSLVCPYLEELKLGWNHICLQGFEKLINSLTRNKRDYTFIRHLDFSANYISSASIECFVNALKSKTFPSLQYVNFSKNPIKDRGAQIISHSYLQGLLVNIRYLNISSCEVRDSGMKAIYSCFRDEKLKTCLMPFVHCIVANNNRPNSETILRYSPFPPYLKV